MTNTKCYSELISIESFVERLNYLRVNSQIGILTFGNQRYLNQMLYHSVEWDRVKRSIIIRDNGFDLAHPEHPIFHSIYVHHINPITVEDVLNRSPKVFDPENLISTSFQSHNIIHFGHEVNEMEYMTIRYENDTCPWK